MFSLLLLLRLSSCQGRSIENAKRIKSVQDKFVNTQVNVTQTRTWLFHFHMLVFLSSSLSTSI
jgi:hypothetical protein